MFYVIYFASAIIVRKIMPMTIKKSNRMTEKYPYCSQVKKSI